MTFLVFATVAALVYWRLWRAEHPRHFSDCPIEGCPARVRDLPRHFNDMHRGSGFVCSTCHSYVPPGHADVHWRLWHTPRPTGPEDRTDWSRR